MLSFASRPPLLIASREVTENSTMELPLSEVFSLYIFNYGDSHEKNMTELSNYKIGWIDFGHAFFLSVFVFLIFAISNSDVQTCLIPNEGAEECALIMNLPLGGGVLESFLLTIFPTTRRRIGYADMPPNL